MPISEKVTFLKGVITKPHEVGAIWPSSKALAEAIVRTAGVSEADTVVEFGPGTGVITEVICEHLKKDAFFIALELNEEYVRSVRNRCPRATIIHDSAANAPAHLEKAGRSSCDCIVSGLPWTIFSDELQIELLDATIEALRPGGCFVTYTYLHTPKTSGGKRFKDKLDSRFSIVERTPVIWMNLPPAFLYRAVK